MGDDAEHRGGPQLGSSRDDSGTVNDPLTQTDVKAPRAKFDGRKPE